MSCVPHRKNRSRNYLSMLSIVLVLSALVAGLCIHRVVRSKSKLVSARPKASLRIAVPRTSADALKVPTSKHPVYPYSVIPGGVRDVADLQEHAARDYVVRRHFARFDYRHARLVRSDKARQVYLSYRLRDRIFWTRKKVRLLQAELLLTDGKITARARCGNQIEGCARHEATTTIMNMAPFHATWWNKVDTPRLDWIPYGNDPINHFAESSYNDGWENFT